MSGRDLRGFLSAHRAGTFYVGQDEGLAGKYLAGSVGFGGRGLQKVDYEQLLSQAQCHRTTAHLQKTKLKSLSKQGQGFKEAWLFRLHQEVWQHEWVRLVTASRRLEVEGEEWRANALIAATEAATEGKGQSAGVEGQEDCWMVDITRYVVELYQEDRRKLEQGVLHEARLLRADLKNWISLSTRPEAERGHAPQWEELRGRLDSVKQRLEESQEILMKECLVLWKEVRQFQETHCREGVAQERGVVRGVPPVIEAMKCSNATLKGSLMAEFASLDQQYEQILQQLADTHSQALSSPHGGWSEAEAERFGYIMEQYPASLGGKRRAAYLHRLAREFPHLARQRLVEHETWYLSMQHYQRQRDAYLRDWQVHHSGLEVKVQSALTDYAREMAVKEAEHVAMETQTALCRKLHHKVSRWRQEKEKQLATEAEREASLHLEEQRKREREEGRRKERRKRVAVKLEAYHMEKETKMVEEEAWLEGLRAETEQLRREKALEGEGRVQYRRELHADRVHRRQEYLEEREEEERERERRLAALRDQVKVHVTSDPERILQQTLSVQARMTSDPELPIQQQLFPLHSFPAHKVTSDPRIRLEEALRKVGLHESEYARHMMATVQACTVPKRPDLQSSLFQNV